MTFEPGTNVCDIGSLHTQGVVRTSGEEVSEVCWPSYLKAGWSEYQYIDNSKLLVWGSDAHQAALLHEHDTPIQRKETSAMETVVRPVRERDVDLMGLFNREGNNDQE